MTWPRGAKRPSRHQSEADRKLDRMMLAVVCVAFLLGGFVYMCQLDRTAGVIQ